ncbi:MAG: CaiB/BaiF CoA-transferase family protein [Trebonia sp.]|jgi:alpha-methylacyl-CoA racemase
MAGSRSGPLAGVRVVELAGIGPGPFCGMLLADLGAEVIRVDRPGGPMLPVPQRNDITSRGKKRVVVDLKHPRGAEVVQRLAAASDALIEGYRPGVAERLGVGPADCWARNPALVYGRMTGWGQDGPLAAAAGHDIAYIALTGALHAVGRAGGPPQVPVNYLGDFGGGSLFLALGVVAAVLSARASGRGQVVDAAIVDGAAVLQAMTYGLLADGSWTDTRGVNLLDTGTPYYDVYETADGRHMAVGALEPRFYAEFTRLLFAPEGVPGDLPAQHDRARWPELRSRFAARFLERSQGEWSKSFLGTDACVAPVLTMTEAPGDPHLAARGTYVAPGGVVQPAPAPRFGTGAPGIPVGALPARPIAAVGTDTRAVLTELGFADTEELLAAGAAWQA